MGVVSHSPYAFTGSRGSHEPSSAHTARAASWAADTAQKQESQCASTWAAHENSDGLTLQALSMCRPDCARTLQGQLCLMMMCTSGLLHAHDHVHAYTAGSSAQQLAADCNRQWLTCFVGGVGRQRGHDL